MQWARTAFVFEQTPSEHKTNQAVRKEWLEL